jgi:raffinose/stachyose/melibiose transport system substrate-binding protein
MKKAVSLAMAATMALSMLPAVPAAAADVSITIFNSKMEIQSQLEEMAAQYSEEKGVDVEVYYSSDTVAAHMSTRYASNEPYTIAMVDAKDIYSLAPDHGYDLSDQDWVADTTQAIDIDGVVYGFPVCVEARGIIYNKTAIEDTLGEEFNPEDYVTYDAFVELIEALKENGMDTPVGIMKEDWSLAAHYLAEVYETRDDPAGFISELHEGAQIIDDERFNTLMDTFDVLKENNYAADAPVAAVREDTELYLAEGEIAFMFGGNWDWSVLAEFDPEGEMGMMPVPQNDDEYNSKLVGGGSKYFFIDNSENTTDEQREAAKDFLNWLVYDEEGQDFLVNTCALVPAFSNIELEVSDPLGQSVKAFADAGALVENYNYLPDDHYAKCGADMQQYLADDVDREGFAGMIDAYWQETTPVEG